jgi:hypothetical protein
MKKSISLLLALGAFGYAHAQNPINNSFESWTNIIVNSKSIDIPLAWSTSDSIVAAIPMPGITGTIQVKKSTNAQVGSSAVSIMTTNQGSLLGDLPGVLTNTKLTLDISALISGADPIDAIKFDEGTAVTTNYNTVEFYAIYNPSGGDRAQVGAQAILQGMGSGGTDSILGTGSLAITSGNNTYQQFSFPITYDVTPSAAASHIQLVFMSSDPTSSPQVGSELIIDNVTFSSQVGIKDKTIQDVKVFPTVVKDNQLNIQLPESFHKGSIKIVNNLGQTIYNKAIESSLELYTGFWAKGYYHVQVIDEVTNQSYSTSIQIM